MRESNCCEIVNSKEFESLDKPLMVEIIRRKLTPPQPVRHPTDAHNEAVISRYTIYSVGVNTDTQVSSTLVHM